MVELGAAVLGAVSLGIDLATANARIVAVDFSERAKVVADVSAPLGPPRFAEGGVARQSPLYAPVVSELMAKMAHLLGDRRGEVCSISVTGTSGTVLGVNRRGEPVGDALLYSDSSGASLDSLIAAEDHRGRPTGSLNRMAQIWQEHSPARILTSADVVAAELTGDPRIPADTSHTLKAGVDTASKCWPERTLQALGIPLEVLPSLVDPGTIVGTLSLPLAKRWGLSAGVTVVAGMTDGCTSQIATGALALGDTVGVLGTTLVLKAVAPGDVRNPDLGVYSHRSPDSSFFPGGASNVGGGSLPPEVNTADIDQLTDASVARGLSPHLVYPLPRPGERFPFANPDATPLGMDRDWAEGELFHATIQAIAMTERLGLETLQAEGVPRARHVVSGGGASSSAMSRLRATILGQPVTRPAFTDSAVGAAVIAAHALSEHSLAEFSAEHQARGKEVDPLGDLRDQAEESYQEFCQMLRQAGYLTERG